MYHGNVKSYKVFVRNWYRRDSTGLVPDPRAPKTTLATRCSEEEARAIVKTYNATHEPGPLSRKAEFAEE